MGIFTVQIVKLMSGTVYMIPVTLGDTDPELTIPRGTREITLSLRLFAVEDISCPPMVKVS